MLRTPLFLVVLCVAMTAAGTIPSPFGVVRSVADHKLAARTKLATHFASKQAVKAPADPKVADDPDAGAENAVTEVPPAKSQELSAAPASDEEVHDAKKRFTAGYAAPDFAKQLEKKRLATRKRMQDFAAAIISLPLDYYKMKHYLAAGDTRGSLTRVIIVEKGVTTLLYTSEPKYFTAQAWVQEDASPTLPEQPAKQQQQQSNEGSSAGPASMFSGYHRHKFIDTTRFPVHGVNFTNFSLKNVSYRELMECTGKVLCTMAARPSVFGPISVNVTESFSSYKPPYSSAGLAYFKLSSDAGRDNEDCENFFSYCRLSAKMIKILFDSRLAL
ncbi:uncharacterized protein LOC125946632 [Dermacentor silvarum]|uniref:uncharacterized protein LOC125946632 n=1 Tax=Dermacentor silvarum TaxID=543639 RepID=UPI002100ECED|nr:uncharacterized protein LOC125946632 [Dermacentor silvarum]